MRIEVISRWALPSGRDPDEAQASPFAKAQPPKSGDPATAKLEPKEIAPGVKVQRPDSAIAKVAMLGECRGELPVTVTLRSLPTARFPAPLPLSGLGRSLHPCFARQHFLCFFPLPHGHGSFRPTFGVVFTT
jgi:hypothetical protein